VAYAARGGAKLASEQPSLAQALSMAGNGQLCAALDHQLQTAGLCKGVCALTLEHNGPDSPNAASDDSSSACENCPTPAGALPTPPVALRLTICVPLEGNVPDLLSSFGFSLAGRKVRHSATFRLESN
jgi:hypothetical protein